jgi:hypothetical protein
LNTKEWLQPKRNRPRSGCCRIEALTTTNLIERSGKANLLVKYQRDIDAVGSVSQILSTCRREEETGTWFKQSCKKCIMRSPVRRFLSEYATAVFRLTIRLARGAQHRNGNPINNATKSSLCLSGP